MTHAAPQHNLGRTSVLFTLNDAHNSWNAGHDGTEFIAASAMSGEQSPV